MKYFSMFSGIRGFEYGIQRACDKQSAKIEQDRQGGNRVTDEVEHDVLPTSRTAPLCVGHSEIDKYAIQISEKHYPEDKNYGDCTKINWSTVPDFECLVGGFPCQAFSIAGKRAGFEDTRGTLFFEIARCLEEKRPRLCVLENVKGLLSHDKGATFIKIIATLSELGYDCQWQVLNSKNFGVPQNRERVFIIGHLRGTSRPEVFPIGESGGNISKTQRAEKCFTAIDANYYKGVGVRGNKCRACVRVALTETRTEEAKKIRRETKDRDFSPRRGKVLVPRSDDMGNCVTGGQSKESFLTDGCKIRRLTPTECERLQGFPDGWTEGISDTQRYKCCGNAVTTNVITAIFSEILKWNP